jgi:hypothetical protein
LAGVRAFQTCNPVSWTQETVPVDGTRTFGQIQPVLPRDPRLRPYRAAMWVAYLLAIALSVGAMVASITRNLTGSRPPSRGALPTRAVSRVCAEELQALHGALNQRAWKLGGEIGAGDAVERFNTWSLEWEQRLEDLGDRCKLDASSGDPGDFTGRAELAQARDAVLSLHRAYRAQVNRFGVEQAELARAAEAALEAARQQTSGHP